MDQAKNHSIYFLIFCILVSVVVVFFLFQPFLNPLIVAGVFAFLFQPIYFRVLKFFKNSPNFSALITTLVAIIIILLPISFLGTQIIIQSTDVYKHVVSGGVDNFVNHSENILDKIRSIFPISENIKIDFRNYAKQGLEILIKNFGSIFSSFTKIILNIFIFLAAFYFLLKDGHKLKNYFVELSPLSDKDDELIISRLKTSVSATIKGSLLIGLIQGILTGIGFAIFSVPNAVLWGSVAAIAALIPGVGTALVLLPGIIFLFITGSDFNAIGLLVWGAVAVGMVDNFLSPKLVGKGMKLHPLIVFLSVLGGFAFFGPLGFLLGPLSVSIFFALVDIYFSLRK